MRVRRPKASRRQRVACGVGLLVWLGCWVFLLTPFRDVEPHFGSPPLSIDCPGPALVGRSTDDTVAHYCDAAASASSSACSALSSLFRRGPSLPTACCHRLPRSRRWARSRREPHNRDLGCLKLASDLRRGSVVGGRLVFAVVAVSDDVPPPSEGGPRRR